jgi:hypothetical protein
VCLAVCVFSKSQFLCISFYICMCIYIHTYIYIYICIFEHKLVSLYGHGPAILVFLLGHMNNVSKMVRVHAELDQNDTAQGMRTQ